MGQEHRVGRLNTRDYGRAETTKKKANLDRKMSGLVMGVIRVRDAIGWGCARRSC